MKSFFGSVRSRGEGEGEGGGTQQKGPPGVQYDTKFCTLRLW